MLPVDKCIGHKCTKWQPARLYHFWVSGRVMKALLSRVTRELWVCLARKRYRSRSDPDLWSTGIRGSALPFPAAGREEILSPPRRLRPARGPAPAGSRPGQPSLPPRQPLMWLPPAAAHNFPGRPGPNAPSRPVPALPARQKPRRDTRSDRPAGPGERLPPTAPHSPASAF